MTVQILFTNYNLFTKSEPTGSLSARRNIYTRSGANFWAYLAKPVETFHIRSCKFWILITYQISHWLGNPILDWQEHLYFHQLLFTTCFQTFLVLQWYAAYSRLGYWIFALTSPWCLIREESMSAIENLSMIDLRRRKSNDQSLSKKN